MPTIRDVARVCGVSPMTVSFVINNTPGQVSEETRERVMKAVRELNYRPSASKRNAVERKILTLGVVGGVPGESLTETGYFSVLLNNILRAADALGHNITLFNHTLLHQDILRAIRVYCDGRCDGLMVIAPRIGSELVAALQERGVPFITVGDSSDDPSISCVDLDNRAVAYELVSYLIQLGHRRIAFIGGPTFVRSVLQRHEGYRQALQDQGLSVPPRLMCDNLFDTRQTTAQVIRLMSLPPDERPTAIFGWNDGFAVDVAHALQHLGLCIPDDVSVAGIDDLQSCDVNPPLTSVRQPYSQIGRHALEALAHQVHGTTTGPSRFLLPGDLRLRASTGPPKQGVEGRE